MGQYHHPVCIEAEEGLNAYDFDCGAKEGEIGFSRPSPVNAMVALVCARGGNMPADCSQSPLISRWAGKRLLVRRGDKTEICAGIVSFADLRLPNVDAVLDLFAGTALRFYRLEN